MTQTMPEEMLRQSAAIVYIPLNSMRQLLGNEPVIMSLALLAEDVSDVDAVNRRSLELLHERHKSADREPYRAMSLTDVMEQANTIIDIVTIFIGAVAADFTSGRRHRRHEHHARFRSGTNTRDRPSESTWSDPSRHSESVHHRISYFDDAGRSDRRDSSALLLPTSLCILRVKARLYTCFFSACSRVLGFRRSLFRYQACDDPPPLLTPSMPCATSRGGEFFFLFRLLFFANGNCVREDAPGSGNGLSRVV